MGKDHYFGASGQTALNPLAILVLVLAIILVFVLPKKHMFAPILVAGLLIPMGQQVVLGGVHLMLIRLLIPFGWIRLMVGRTKGSRIRWTTMDTVFVAYVVSDAILYTVRWAETGALINRVGFAYDALGTYFMVRYLVREPRDVDRITKTFACLAIVFAGFMINEQMTGHNVFAAMGTRDLVEIRDGKYRSQGPFEQTLTAGTFGGTLMALFFGLWWQSRKNRKIAYVGMAGSLLMAMCSMSSTPVLSVVLGILALCMWRLRQYLKWFRWGTVSIIVGLHMVMNAPVWSLIGRIDLTGSSSGYHRYQLVDQFIRRFGEWWVCGTNNTYNWGWDMWDTCDAWVTAGTEGGFLTFVLFVTLMTVAFWHLGKTRRAWAAAGNPENVRRLWAFGAMLFATSVSFIGIAYFDQTSIAWYTELAMIASLISLKPTRRRPMPAVQESVPAMVARREVQIAHS